MVIPFEFTIEGPPVSQQAHPRQRLMEWKQRVRERARGAVQAGDRPHEGQVLLMITYYYDRDLPVGDLDNIGKPIQDALEGIVYANARQVEEVSCARRDMNSPLRIKGISPVLAAGFTGGREFLHVKVDHPRDPQELRQ